MRKYRERLEEAADRERVYLSLYKEFSTRVIREVKGICLEIGCGDGLSTAFLKGKVSFLVSLDLSEKRIKRARTINRDVTFILADACQLPFKNETFDTVCAFEVIEHLPSPKHHIRFLEEVKRVLVKDGIFLISTPNKPLFRIYCKILKEKHSTHFSELSYTQFRHLLHSFFPVVRIYGQFGWLSPLIEFSFFRKLHSLLSRVTFMCKGLMGVCIKR